MLKRYVIPMALAAVLATPAFGQPSGDTAGAGIGDNDSGLRDSLTGPDTSTYVQGLPGPLPPVGEQQPGRPGVYPGGAAGPAMEMDQAQPMQPPRQQAAMPAAATVTSDALIGRTARTAAGEEVGEIENLVISPQDGEITHVIVDVGGFLGTGGKRVAVDWNNVRMTREAVVMEINRDQLQAAPAFGG